MDEKEVQTKTETGETVKKSEEKKPVTATKKEVVKKPEEKKTDIKKPEEKKAVKKETVKKPEEKKTDVKKPEEKKVDGEKKKKKAKTFKSSMTADKILLAIQNKEIKTIEDLKKCGKGSIISAIKKRGGKITIDVANVKNINNWEFMKRECFMTTFFSAIQNF